MASIIGEMEKGLFGYFVSLIICFFYVSDWEKLYFLNIGQFDMQHTHIVTMYAERREASSGSEYI
jgi:hypothetical protein